MKNSEYETGFEDIFIQFNKKIFKVQKRKLKVPPDSNPSRIHFVASCEHFIVLLSFLIFM